MKKHHNRPALRGADVWRWRNNGILEVDEIKLTPILYFKRGKSVRQTWLKRNTFGKIHKQTAITYLSKGSFLVPLWQPVPKWEMDYLHQQGIDHYLLGIVRFGKRYLRLIYMQVEDLDHLGRQQEHVLDNYLVGSPLVVSDVKAFFIELERQRILICKISRRKIGVNNFQVLVNLKIRTFYSIVKSIAANAPIFGQKVRDQDLSTTIKALRRLSNECRLYAVRPIGRRLSFIARSLDLAILHLQNSRPILARARLYSALKGLEQIKPSPFRPIL